MLGTQILSLRAPFKHYSDSRFSMDHFHIKLGGGGDNKIFKLSRGQIYVANFLIPCKWCESGKLSSAKKLITV